MVPLLTMIRINEVVLSEAQKRECNPLETFLIGLRLNMWPTFQKEMTAHVDSLKKLVDGAGAGYLSRGTVLKDSWIQLVSVAAAFGGAATSNPHRLFFPFDLLHRSFNGMGRCLPHSRP